MSSKCRFGSVIFDHQREQKKRELLQVLAILEKMINTIDDADSTRRYKALSLTALEEAAIWVQKALREEQLLTTYTDD